MPAGIRNDGAQCYLISVMQSLNNVDALRLELSLFAAGPDENLTVQQKMMLEMGRLFHRLRGDGATDVSELYDIFLECGRENFMRGRQEDAAE